MKARGKMENAILIPEKYEGEYDLILNLSDREFASPRIHRLSEKAERKFKELVKLINTELYSKELCADFALRIAALILETSAPDAVIIDDVPKKIANPLADFLKQAGVSAMVFTQNELKFYKRS